MALLFLKSPYEILRIAAFGEDLGTFTDVNAKNCDTILKHIYKTRKADNLACKPLGSPSDSRDFLMEYIRNGEVTAEHPVFTNWNCPSSAGLKTAFNRTSLISSNGHAKKIFKSMTDPEAGLEDTTRSFPPNSETAVFQSQVSPRSNPNSQIMIDSQSGLPSSQSSLTNTSPSNATSLNKKKQKEGSSMSKSDLSNIIASVTSGIREDLDRSRVNFDNKLSSELKTVHTLFLNSSNKFTKELETKASENYVREQVNLMDSKLDNYYTDLSSKIKAVPMSLGNSSSSSSQQTLVNTDDIKRILARLDECEIVMLNIKEHVLPDATTTFIAAQIDIYVTSRIDFRNAINGQKRSGLLFLSVPEKFFIFKNNRAEIDFNQVAEIIQSNFLFKSRVTINKDRTLASCKIQVTSIKKGDDALELVDAILARRRDLQQNHGILLKPSVVQKFHFSNVLNNWIREKIIFSFESTLGGQYRIFIGDGEDNLTTATARNKSCTDYVIDNPPMVFRIRNPSTDKLLQIHSGSFFPAENGLIYPVPEDKRWIFESYNAKQVRMALPGGPPPVRPPNMASNHQNAPSVLQTKPLQQVAAEVVSLNNTNRNQNQGFNIQNWSTTTNPNSFHANRAPNMNRSPLPHTTQTALAPTTLPIPANLPPNHNVRNHSVANAPSTTLNAQTTYAAPAAPYSNPVDPKLPTDPVELQKLYNMARMMENMNTSFNNVGQQAIRG